MANPNEGEVSFEALGNTYTLKLTSRAVAKIENDFERGIGHVVQEMAEGSVRAMAAVIKHALVERVKEGTEWDIIDDVGMTDLGTPLGKAIEISGVFKGATESVGDEGKPQATGG